MWVIAYSVPISAFMGIALGGKPGGLLFWCYWTAIYSFILHPILDQKLGRVTAEGLERNSKGPFQLGLNHLLLLLTLPTQAILLTFGLVTLHTQELSILQQFGIIFSLGISAGAFGITSAHELIHRRSRVERGMGVLLLALTLYAHFRVEHVFGHHRWVATPEDTATAREGESLYAFILRAFRGSWKVSWNLESKKPWWENRLTHYVVLQGLLMILIGGIWGGLGILAYLGQSLVGILLLKGVDYIEHYGLTRRELSPGVYEPFSEKHSWDSDFWLTNSTLFSLGLHAHHHSAALVPFEKLRAKPQAPQLPWGYSLAILVACIPSLWMKAMQSHLEAVKKNQRPLPLS